ncbi:hypothetical protein GCM10011515_22690 [Tsuneonella deserti]|uniref:Uncharacterized protein n=1 Tax=Tsuneonella deserti TaxID=2035528 RepID=A0ABQ1SBR9_9SPHN|nr:hypothetical protein [Tsuneonella deserti]GGE02487.1 hypothetical protein GCM10011515_22690 [Tsuneonella deserti]
MSDKPNRKKASQPPVSAHPAFPVIIAVWFAALLGIGSLVLPIGLFERYAAAIGLADAFEAARPPFGMTARAIIALVAASLGALLGIFLARRVAAANAPRSIDEADPTPAYAADLQAKRPISAHEELFDGGLDADELPQVWHDSGLLRRRARAAAGLEDVDEPAPAASPAPEGLEVADEPLDLSAFSEPEVAALPDESVAMAEPEQEMPNAGTDIVRDAPALAGRPLGELGMVELVERFAMALQRHREVADSATADVMTASAPAPAIMREWNFEEGFDHDWDEANPLPDLDLPSSLSVPDAPRQPLTQEPDEHFGDDMEDDDSTAEYPSLLAMKSPVGLSRQPVRIADDDADAVDEPVVVFPAQGNRSTAPASDSDEVGAPAPRPLDARLARAQAAARAYAARSHAAPTPGRSGNPNEQALRAALEKLQKLSGAA